MSALQEGRVYRNGLGDEVGPIQERTPGVFIDQHGGIYYPDGRQWNHTADSAGNIVIRGNLSMKQEFGWLIEAPIHDADGPYYLCVQNLAGCHFYWGPDHQQAIRFSRMQDAEAIRDAVRQVRIDLFPTIMPMPQAVEHGWDNPAEIKRVIAGCQHPFERMVTWNQEGACPICLTATVAMVREQNARLSAALENIMNGISTGAIVSDHDETFANAIKRANEALTKGSTNG